MGWWGRTIVESVQADSEVIRFVAARLDVTRACLESFATAASGGTPFLIQTSQMVHGAAVTEAVAKSAASGKVERIA
jgi:hypothetical protein